MNSVVVIKVGGSLFTWDEFPRRFRKYLDDRPAQRSVVVAGGGGAADFVRELDSLHGIGEKRSHGLALRALDLSAHTVATLVPNLTVVERPEALADVWKSGRVPLLAPRWFLENIDRHSARPLDETWEATTDSIAARVAVFLGAGTLELLKSVGLDGSTSRDEAARRGLVDLRFPRESAPIGRVKVVNLRGIPPTTDVLT